MLFLVLGLMGCVASSPVGRAPGESVLLVSAREGSPQQSQTLNSPTEELNNNLPAGHALDLFYRFGFFSLSVRVVPREDAGSWVIREPTSEIFTEGSARQVTLKEANKFQDEFQIYFCDSLTDLMKHYFHDFNAEGVVEPYSMFTGSWRNPTTAKYFGLSEDTLHSDTGFVLIKLVKEKVTVRVEGDPKLKPEADQLFQQIKLGDRDSVEKFVQNYGSHFIKSLTVGDAVYQILALDSKLYAKAKDDVLLSRKVTDFNEIYDNYLAPWLVKDNGRVQVASGDLRTQNFLKEKVVKRSQFEVYPSIFEVRRQPLLLDQLEELTQDTNAVVAMDFKSLGSLIPDLQKQDFFKEIVNTQLTLWEANI